MSKPLQLKHRPEYLEDMFGNKETLEMVSTVLNRELETIPHAWLLTGSTGTGKTTIARIIREELGCANLDFHEYNSSDTRGIDTIREIQNTCKLAPIAGNVKVYLMDEVHQITGPAQEAMLKMLEDAPNNVFFLLATTNPEKLKKTLKSRCTTVQLNPLNSKEMGKLLDTISQKENYDITSEVRKTIISCSEGSPRNSLKLLDSIIDIDNEETAIKTLQKTTIGEVAIIELCRAILKNEPWKTITDILKNLNEDPESIRYAILGYLTKVLMSDGRIQVARKADCFLEPYYNSGKSGLILSCYQASMDD